MDPPPRWSFQGAIWIIDSIYEIDLHQNQINIYSSLIFFILAPNILLCSVVLIGTIFSPTRDIQLYHLLYLYSKQSK